MRRRLLRTPIARAAVGVFLWAAACLAAALAVVALAGGLPPEPQAVDARAWRDIAARTVRGAYHIHTTRSDGHGDKADVARAAAAAGLKFVILTDHGDATRPPDSPEYIDGVLCIDAVEISTDDGHYVALDMPRAPYPLGGAAEAVVEDVRRLGGFGIAAHPDSPKPSLRWTDTTAPIDGIEWLSADSTWRDRSRAQLLRAGIAYFFRPGPALATLLERPVTLDRWDGLARSRQVVGLAGTDAHGGVGHRAEDMGRSLAGTVGFPSYRASFSTFSDAVTLDAPLSGEAPRDARALYAAIRTGRVFTVIDAVATPGLLDFHRDRDTLVVHATVPRGGEIVLLCGGQEVSRSTVDLRYDVGQARAGAYRVEVRLPYAPGNPPVPWMVSNPVYVGIAAGPAGGAADTAADTGAADTGAAAVTPGRTAAVPTPTAPFPWRIEKDPASSAQLQTTERSADLTYSLAPGGHNSQFVALATDVKGEAFGGMRFGLSADRPMRVSVQVRDADGRRWGKSAYVDPEGRAIAFRLWDLRPIAGQGRPDPARLRSVLLVIDLTNAAPGSVGHLRVLSSDLVK